MTETAGSDDTLRLDGALTAGEVARLERRYRERFAGGRPPRAVDLERVESVDSSALALLLEWQALARPSGGSIRFEHAPESLRVIARLTGVSALLGWREGNTKADSAKEES